MTRYLLRRLALAIPTMFGVATVSFLLMRLIPGDPARVIAGIEATPEDVERIRAQLGLDEPVLTQYTTFLSNLVTGNLGTSTRSGQPVLDEIVARLPHTLELALITIAVAVPLGCALGVVAAVRRGRLADILGSLLAVAGVSIPVYWMGLLLVIVFAVNLKLLPAAGAGDTLSFVLPVVTLAAFTTGFIARQTRAAMLEVLGEDYMRTARAKGASRLRVVWRHGFRNALLPVVTTIGIQFGSLLGGAVLTETVFAWPGMGRLLVDAIGARDFAMVQGAVFVFAAMLVLVNLITDLLYAYIDPRISYGD